MIQWPGRSRIGLPVRAHSDYTGHVHSRRLSPPGMFSSLAFTVAVALALCSCDSSKDAQAPAKAEAKAPTKADPQPAAGPAPAPVEKAAAPKPEEEPTYGKELCATIIPCFEKLKFTGSFSAEVTADIEPDGKVSAVSFTGEAPKPVQTCITSGIEAMTVSPYNGKPGRTTCKQSGQLSGGTRMVMSDSTYEEREPTP
jgi:hypothetical protein